MSELELVWVNLPHIELLDTKVLFNHYKGSSKKLYQAISFAGAHSARSHFNYKFLTYLVCGDYARNYRDAVGVDKQAMKTLKQRYKELQSELTKMKKQQ
jgi:hypothetical protein